MIRTISGYDKSPSTTRILYITSREDEIRRLFDTIRPRVACVTVIGMTEDYNVLSYSSREGLTKVSRFQMPIMPIMGHLIRGLALIVFQLTIVWRSIVSRSMVNDVTICTSAIHVFLLTPFHRLGAIRKLVFYVGDYFPQSEKMGPIARIKHRLYQKMDGMAWEEADAVWCYTHAIRNRIATEMPLRSKFVKFVPPLYFPAGDLPPDLKDPTIVYVGGLRKGAGIELTLDALKQLPSGLQIPKLELFGLESEHDVLANLRRHAAELNLEEKLIIRGHVSITELQKSLQKALCGLAIFPAGNADYSNYAYPNKVKTYVENGIVPIIGFSSALNEHSEFRDFALFVEETPEGVSQAISLLVRNPELAQRMGAAAFAYGQREHNHPAIFREIESVLAEQGI